MVGLSGPTNKAPARLPPQSGELETQDAGQVAGVQAYAPDQWVKPTKGAPGKGAPKPVVRPPDGRPILLYNDDCSVCRKISSWVIKSDEPSNGGHQLIDERPIGSDPEALKVLNPNLDIFDAYANV